MKKPAAVILALCLCILFLCAGCAQETEKPAAESAAAEPVTVDLDLTVLSSTVVYAQVYNLMYDPSPYLGKILRISGWYSVYVDPQTGMVYHACVIPDATACCTQGLEFVWGGDHPYPDDYMEEGTTVTVTGRLEMYAENGANYLHLVDSDVVWSPEEDEA